MAKNSLKFTALILLFIVLTQFVLSSCAAAPAAVSIEKFTEEGENLGFQVVKITNGADEPLVYRGAVIGGGEFIFRFLVYESEKDAKNAYGESKSRIKNSDADSVTDRKEVDKSAKQSFSQTSGGLYRITVRIGATLIYACCMPEEKSRVDEILKSIKYL